MSPKRRSKKSPECRSRMSLLTVSRATFRGVCHNDSEVEGGAAEEGLANDTRADRTRGVRQGHRRGDGDSSADGESRVAAGRSTARPAADSAQEQARPLQAAGRSATWGRSVERASDSARDSGRGLPGSAQHSARLYPAQTAAAHGAGDGAVRNRTGPPAAE